jgi:hypothetical protein
MTDFEKNTGAVALERDKVEPSNDELLKIENLVDSGTSSYGEAYLRVIGKNRLDELNHRLTVNRLLPTPKPDPEAGAFSNLEERAENVDTLLSAIAYGNKTMGSREVAKMPNHPRHGIVKNKLDGMESRATEQADIRDEMIDRLTGSAALRLIGFSESQIREPRDRIEMFALAASKTGKGGLKIRQRVSKGVNATADNARKSL